MLFINTDLNTFLWKRGYREKYFDLTGVNANKVMSRRSS